jgi:hypothetical protein
MVLIGLGLVIVMIDPRAWGVDVLADWAGWILILIGSWAMCRHLPSGRLILGSGVVALAVAVATWPTSWALALMEQEDALQWAATLPQLAWLVLFNLALAGLSRRTDPGASFWWKYLAAMNVGSAILPIAIYGGGVEGLSGLYLVLQIFGLWGTTAFTFLYSGRDWAVVPKP